MNVSKHRYITTGTAALLVSLLLLSCTKEDFGIDGRDGQAGQYGDSISFGVSPNSGAVTKSSGSDASAIIPQSGLTLRSQDSADSLYVGVTVSDGVSSQDDNQLITRATPVTAENFYDSFQVLAYWYQNSKLIQDQFYMRGPVTKTGSATDTDAALWGTATTYYWPGAGNSLEFYAWAPSDAAFSATPTAPSDKSLTYTVPPDVAGQQDIVVATTNLIAGDNNTAVPLTFKHIFTAIRFEIGSQMQPGTITGIALKGVHSTGTYDMSAASWTLTDATADYSQTLTLATTGTETAGTAITTDPQTFMMLPQSLPEGASVEVEFTDNTTGSNRTLTASLSGSTWQQGKTVTYKIGISPEYDFQLSTERVLDAHYEILLTDLEVSGIPADVTWTVTAPPNVTVQAQSDMNEYSRQGYWTDRNYDGSTDTGSARGAISYSGTGSGTFPIAVFVPENAGDAARTLDLAVTVGEVTAKTFTLTQLCPNWYGTGIGCERLQSPDSPWGFYWSSDYALIYDLTGCSDTDRKNIRIYVEWTKALHTLQNTWLIGLIITAIFGPDIPDLGFVDMDKSDTNWWGGGKADRVTINLGQLTTDGVAESETDGRQNTHDMYNFEGIQLANEIINNIENMPGSTVTQQGTGTNPTNNAAIACMKLNSFNVVTMSTTAGSGTLLKLSDSDDNLPIWYLPSMGEISGISDSEYDPISGEYWTSTAVNDNQNAYKYLNGATSAERRDVNLHVRAVRKKP